MAVKGDRALLEPQAKALYAQGHTLTSIAERLGVSIPTLSKWKAESQAEGEAVDGWDKARGAKRASKDRIRALYDRQIELLEATLAEDITAPMVDALAKLGALVDREEKLDQAKRVADDVVATARKAGITDQVADDFRRKILGIAG